MKTVHVFVSGTVQGIGFRQFAKSTARKLGVTGWVRDIPDGRVEAVVQGSEEAIDQLLKRLKIGPFLAEVKNISIEELEEKEVLDGFEIRQI